MTCIVAIAHKKKVYMGADSYGSNGRSGTEVLNPKCFINGEFLIGSTTSFRIIDLLQYKLSVPKVHEDEHKDNDKFMRTYFIEAVHKCFKDNGRLKTKEGVDNGGNFLVGYRGKVYEIQDDFSILNVPVYGGSVGSGENAARGSLWTTSKAKMLPKARIIIALESAVSVNCGVRAPFNLLEL